jgi:hypothetical protein
MIHQGEMVRNVEACLGRERQRRAKRVPLMPVQCPKKRSSCLKLGPSRLARLQLAPALNS